jgi:hypothetical protein
MPSRRLYAFILITVALVAAGAYFDHAPTAGAGQKPVVPRPLHFDGGLGAPPTLEELWRMSPLVIDARVRAKRPADQTILLPGDPPHVFVKTAYELAIQEMFKDETDVGATNRTIEVTQDGGERDRGDFIESFYDDQYPPLQLHERYVFFLKPSVLKDGTFTVATDTADSALLLAPDATVKSRGRSKLARQMERFSREGVLKALRDLKEAGK